MTTPTGDRPDPAEVQATVANLTELPDQQFAEALADCVMDPDPVEQAAFRSDDLALRALVAARYLIDNVNATIRQRADESGKAWALRAEHYRNRIGMERRLLESIVAGIRARDGQIMAAPNPRGRAMRRLAEKHPQEFLELVRDEQEAVAERRRAEKAERKRQRQAARGQE